jgi:hypothetical protein
MQGQVLGEIVTGVVNGLTVKPIDALTLAAALVAVVVGFGARSTYSRGHERATGTFA